MRGRLNSSGVNESSDVQLKSSFKAKDAQSPMKLDTIMALKPTEGALKKMDRKTVRMADDPSERKSVRSRDQASHKSVDPYESKTVEEIEVEMDKLRDKVERLDIQINKLKDNKLKSKNTIAKEIQPLRAELKASRDLVERLAILREEKIPFYEKLPKDSIFYKHYVSNLFTGKIHQTTVETAKTEENLLKEVGENIQRVRPDEEDVKKAKQAVRKPSR